MITKIFVMFYVAILFVLGLFVKWEYARLKTRRSYRFAGGTPLRDRESGPE